MTMNIDVAHINTPTSNSGIFNCFNIDISLKNKDLNGNMITIMVNLKNDWFKPHPPLLNLAINIQYKLEYENMKTYHKKRKTAGFQGCYNL